MFLAYTGLRRGEALALGWDDVDIAHGTVRVERQFIQEAGPALLRAVPKTASGFRTIPLAQLAGEIMARLPRRGDWVFIERPEHLDPNAPMKAFARAAKSAGIEWAHLHCLRHTFASVAIVAVVPIEVLWKILGHCSVAVTSRVYAHLLPGATRDAGDRMGRYLGQLSGNQARPTVTEANQHPLRDAGFNWSCRWDSNPQPADYKSAALPIELRQQKRRCQRA